MALEHPSLFVASLVAFAAGMVYLVVAREFRTRISHALPASRRPLLFFALWWAALGTNIVLGGLLYMAASFGYTDYPLQVVYSIVQRLLLCVSLVGLMYYLLYLLSGRDWLAVLVAYYSTYFLFVVYIMYSGEPQGVHVGAWRTDLDYTRDNAATYGLANFLLLVLPPVVAALAYFFRFFFRSDERALRYRIGLVAWAITVWWIMAVVAGQREAFGNEEFQLVNRITGLLAALSILAAYRPPAWVRRWLEADVRDASVTA